MSCNSCNSCNSNNSCNSCNSCNNQGGCNCGGGRPCRPYPPYPPFPPTCDNPSITVGTTTTGAPGTQAMVTNSGTSCNAVLNFTIPQGQPGPQGLPGTPGAQGLPGTPGQAATVTIGTTTTGAAGSAATVTNTGTAQNAVLNFTIPQGTAGSNAPAGLAAYGGLYNAATQTVTLTTANTYEQIALDTPTPLSNITAAANELTVAEAGDYEISYSVFVTSNNAVTMTVSARNNDAVIAPTSSTQALVLQTTGGTDYVANFASKTIATLAAGSVIDLAILSTTLPGGLTTTIGANGDATITLKKLNA